VPGGIGQRLLEDAVDRQLRRGRRVVGIDADRHLHGKTGGTVAVDQGLNIGHTGLSPEGRRVVAEQPDDASNVGEAGAPLALGFLKRRRGFVRGGPQYGHARRSDVEHRHRQRVGHDVVDIPRDLPALVGRRLPGKRLPRRGHLRVGVIAEPDRIPGDDAEHEPHVPRHHLGPIHTSS
jgi:hypothetical protein